MVEYRVISRKRDIEQAIDLEIAVWGLNPRDATPANLILALHHAGGVLMGAYDGNKVVGIAFAFPSRKEDRVILWSHMTGIHQDYQGQGIGFELKLRQREWALANDYDEISWTFDPLQRGNANFNMHRLGACAQQYHVNFYGVMQDEINRADLPSDRIEAVWMLNDPHVVQRLRTMSAAETRTDLPYLLMDHGVPVATSLTPTQPEYLVQVPPNLAQLPADAQLAWRLALRNALTSAFDCGYAAVDFTDSNAYLLCRS